MSGEINVGEIRAAIGVDWAGVTAGLKQVKAEMAGAFKTGAANANKSTASMVPTLDGVIDAVKGLGAAWAAVSGVMKGLDMARQNAVFEDSKRVFEASGHSLQEFRDATKGMISDSQLVTKFGLAQQMGISAEEFKTLAMVADAAAKKTGQSQEYMFQSIMVGTSRSSRLILDNLGIIVDWDKAHQKFAKEHKKTTKQLTEQERKQAEVNMVMAQGRDLIKEVAAVSATQSDVFDQLDAATGNLTTSIGSLFLPAAREMINVLGFWSQAIQDIIGGQEKLSKLDAAKEGAGSVFDMANRYQAQVDEKKKSGKYASLRLDSGTFIPPDQVDAFIKKLRLQGKATSDNADAAAAALDKQKKKQEEENAAAEAAKKTAAQRLKIEEKIAELQAGISTAGKDDVTAGIMKIKIDATNQMNAALNGYTGKDADKLALQLADALNVSQAEELAGTLEGVKSMEEFSDVVSKANDVLGELITDMARDSLNAKTLEGRMAHGNNDGSVPVDVMGERDDLIRKMNDDLGLTPPPKAPAIIGNMQSLADVGEVGAKVSNAVNDAAIPALADGLASGDVKGVLSTLGGVAGMAAGIPMAGAIIDAGFAIVDMFTQIVGTIGEMMTRALGKIVSSSGALGEGLSKLNDDAAKTAGDALLGAFIGGAIGSVVSFGVLGMAGAAAGGAATGGVEGTASITNFLLELSMASQEFADFTTVLKSAADMLIKPLGLVWDALLPIAGAFAIMVEAFAPMLETLVLFLPLQPVVEWVVQSMAMLGTVMAMLIDQLAQWAIAITKLLAPFKKQKNLDAELKAEGDIRRAAIDAMGKFAAMTDDTAKAKAKQIIKDEQLADATDKLTSSILNAPTGFRVEAYRYGAQRPSPNGGGGSNDPEGAIPPANVNVENVFIDAHHQSIEDIFDGLVHTTTKQAAQQTGNSHFPYRPPKGPPRR